MAIPPADASEDETRRFFARMRGLYEEAAQRYAGSVDMKYLSMGMSGSYLAAIREGKRIALANKETLVCAGELEVDLLWQGQRIDRVRIFQLDAVSAAPCWAAAAWGA